MEILNKRLSFNYLKKTAFLFTFFSIISVVLIFIFEQFERNLLIEEAEKSALVDLEHQKNLIMNQMESIRFDLMFLPRLGDFNNFINEGNDADKSHLEQVILAYIKSRQIYDQIRYIDENGNEVIRVNYNRGEPSIVDEEVLQNKRDRYYFRETISLDPNEIYMSPFDLNVENNKIELPVKPMIRFCFPIENDNQMTKGIIVYNFLGNNILYDLKSATRNQTGTFFLLNANGDWLYHSNPDYEWGFMYPDRKKYNMQNLNPQLWERISDSDTQIISENNIYTSIKVNPGQNNEWILMNTIAFEEIGITWKQILLRLRSVLFSLAVIELIIALVITEIISNKNRHNIERLYAEEKLKVYEKRSWTYLQNSPACTIILDLDMKLQFISRAGKKILHLDEKQSFIGKPYPFDFFPDSYRRTMSEILKKVKKNGEKMKEEAPVFDIDGNEIWLQSTIIPINDDQNLLDYIMIVSVDVSERQRALIALKDKQILLEKQNKELIDAKEITEKNEKQIRIVTDNLPILISQIDKDFKYLFANRYYYKQKPGLENIVGKKVVDIIGQETFNRAYPNMQKALSGENVRFENHHLFADGRSLFLETHYIPYIIKGHIESFFVLAMDITERKKAEMEKMELQEQLIHKSKMDAVGQLAGGMAHDFNNMLSGIMGAAQLLLRPKRNLDEKGVKYAGMILQASERAAATISKLLTFGRKESLSFNEVDMNAVIDETVSITRNTFDKKIIIRVVKKTENSMVIGDNSNLQNVLLNLCINASHSMENGGEIHIVSDNINLDQSYCDTSNFEIEPGTYCRIRVSDTGSGIPPEILDHIFEPFFTTKDKGEGTGLGLSVVYGTIQDHKGSIEVQSDFGSGTTFHILLPCSDRLGSQANDTEPEIIGNGTILLVDDEEFNRILTKDILESLGYSVLLAENGTESINIFSEKHSEIDIVLMDMIMPELNGSEAFLKMKDIDEKCKVIISSGYTHGENIDELKSRGLAGFIKKPYSISEISQLLNDVKR